MFAGRAFERGGSGLSGASSRFGLRQEKGLRMTAMQATDLTRQVLSKVGEEKSGLVLYGSRARGTFREDSDVDVLQLVEESPRSYSIGSMNVTVYTPAHLTDMAMRGSLFVRHLIDEGIILSDPQNLVASAFEAYREPESYFRLKTELRLLLEAMVKSDAAQYRPLLDNLARFSVRSALYVRTAESGKPLFDVDEAADAVGLPQVATLIRGSIVEDLGALIDSGVRLLDVALPQNVPNSLHAITVWSMDRYPLVFNQLEQAIAGNAQIDYSLLTLPPS